MSESVIEKMGLAINGELGWLDNPKTGANIARAALSAAEEVGWVMVPKEPTKEIAAAVHKEFSAEEEDRRMLFMGVWLRGHRAMLEKAAKP